MLHPICMFNISGSSLGNTSDDFQDATAKGTCKMPLNLSPMESRNPRSQNAHEKDLVTHHSW